MSNYVGINRAFSEDRFHFATGDTRSSTLTIVGYPIGSLQLTTKVNGTKVWYHGSNGGGPAGAGTMGRIVTDTGAAISATFTRKTVALIPVSPYAMMASQLRLVMTSAQSSSDVHVCLKG